MAINPLRPAIQSYSAVVLGSTGNVGRQIVNLLSANSAVRQVVVVNRRRTGQFEGASTVREVVVPDMDELAEAAEHAASEVGAAVGFCAIGVGKGSRKMPDSQVRKVEIEYPAAFAKGCKAAGIISLGVLSAAGVDSKSWLKYVRIIGEKEQAVIAVGVPALSLYKPSVILGNSNTPSYLNSVFPAVEWLLPSRYHSIHKNELARAMVEGTQKALAEMQRGGAKLEPEVKFYEYREMKKLLQDRSYD